MRKGCTGPWHSIANNNQEMDVEQEWIIRGVPGSLAKDAWWMDSDAGLPGGGGAAGLGGAPRGWDAARRRLGLVLLALLVLGDFLFFGHAPGLSLGLFAAAVFGGCVLVHESRQVVRPALLFGLAALPVVDDLQLLSVGFLLAGLVASVAWLRAPDLRADKAHLWLASRGILRRLPVAGVQALFATLARAPSALRGRASPRQSLHNWGFPLGGALVLAALLTDANPVFSGWLDGLLRFNLDLALVVRRLALWCGLGLLVWPFLEAAGTVAPPAAGQAKAQGKAQAGGVRLGLNPASVANALVLFNLMLGLQTLMDAVYLWTGASLPQGMSFGTYAQRGAYPLLITALLAGAFALATRPFVAESRSLRGLVLLWLGQNVALTLSAALRLKLYVAAYGLTYLRVHAGIWMALVALGLALTGWQILRALPNRWLLLRSAALGLGMLYLCAFVNFASLIASYNLSRPQGTDLDYLCALGPSAAVPLQRAQRPDLPCTPIWPQIEGWRDWGFRNWLVRRYLEAGPGGALE